MESHHLNKITDRESPVDRCPHLGLDEDPLTSLEYASDWNYCYHCSPKSVPILYHQTHYCLSANHSSCPVFNAESGARMPDELKASPRKHIRQGLKLVHLFIPLILLGLILAFLVSEGILPLQPGQFSNNTQQLTLQAAYTQQAEILLQTANAPTITPTATTVPTSTPTPTLTPIPRVLRALNIPIGKEKKFVVHQVASGESLSLLAREFNTSITAIKSVNVNLYTPLWIDTILVIPLDFSDVTEFPAFEPYQLEQPMTVREVANVLSIILSSTQGEDFLNYNDLKEDLQLETGEWVLIPRPRTFR